MSKIREIIITWAQFNIPPRILGVWNLQNPDYKIINQINLRMIPVAMMKKISRELMWLIRSRWTRSKVKKPNWLIIQILEVIMISIRWWELLVKVKERTRSKWIALRVKDHMIQTMSPGKKDLLCNLNNNRLLYSLEVSSIQMSCQVFPQLQVIERSHSGVPKAVVVVELSLKLRSMIQPNVALIVTVTQLSVASAEMLNNNKSSTTRWNTYTKEANKKCHLGNVTWN